MQRTVSRLWLAPCLFAAAPIAPSLAWQGASRAAASTVAVSTAPDTHHVCDLLGLGGADEVPFNFPGADAQTMAEYRALAPGLIEASLPAGGNPAVARIFGTDLGAPFRHGDGRTYFTFGDALYPGSEHMTTCPEGSVGCQRHARNDDVLASIGPETWSGSSECLALTIESEEDPTHFRPITWNGPASAGGVELGPGVVPGPGFSTGRFMFMLVPRGPISCTVAANDCADVGGLPGDVCIPASTGADRGACHFGECGSDPASPCALRLSGSLLMVRRQGSDFETARIGEHVASAAVVDAYRGNFSTVAFHAQVDDAGNGKVWVLGRPGFWGAPGLSMLPHMMFHPVSNGILGEPQFFAGLRDGAPVYSSDAHLAEPLYRDEALLNNHTSLAYLPELDGGTWVMLYGGHSQYVLRFNIAQFIKPVHDDLFFDRNTGILLRWAKQPWGPWSAPQVIFNPYAPGQGGYCERMYFEDPEGRTGFTCPAEQADVNARLNRSPGAGLAGEYGAAIVQPRTAAAPDAASFTFQWLLSTWNPYRVVLMQTRLGTPLLE